MAIKITVDEAPPPQPPGWVALCLWAGGGAMFGAALLFLLLLIVVIPWWLVGLLFPALDFDTMMAGWGYDDARLLAAMPWHIAAALGMAGGCWALWHLRGWRASHNGLSMQAMSRRLRGRSRRLIRRERIGLASALAAFAWFPLLIALGPKGADWLPRTAEGGFSKAMITGMIAIPLLLLANGWRLLGSDLSPGRFVASQLAYIAYFLVPFAIIIAIPAAAIGGYILFADDVVPGGRRGGPGGFLGLAAAILSIWLGLRLGFGFQARFERRVFTSGLAREAEARRSDRRPPVVYLRSFGDDFAFVDAHDGEDIRDRKIIRIEDMLANAARAYGPVIAIGQPGAPPDSGAARAYFSDDDWQQAVRDWIGEARFVMIVAGYTGGVSWELETVLAHGHAAKMIIVFPPDQRHFAARWQWLEQRTKASRVAFLPAKPVANTLLACLDRDGEILLFVSAKPLADRYRSALAIALYELFRL